MSESASACALQKATKQELQGVVIKLLRQRSERQAKVRNPEPAANTIAKKPLPEPECTDHDEDGEEENGEHDEEVTPEPVVVEPPANPKPAKMNSTSHRKEWMMLGRRVEALPREKFPECHKLWDGTNEASRLDIHLPYIACVEPAPP